VSTTAFLSTSPSALAKQSNTVQNDPKVVRNTPIITMDTVKSTSKSIELSKAKSPEPSSFQESVSGFVAGASVSVTKTLIKFPLDTATVRVQMPNSQYSIRDPFGLFKGCFNGISLTLLLNIPAGAVFFSVKDAVKTAIKSSDGSIANMPVWLRTSFAVLLALPPYWLVRNPSEVVKVRQQANIDGYGGDVSAIDAIKQTFKSDSKDDGEGNNASDFYTGYRENVLYAFPADVIKFVAYESITKGRKDISPFEGAGAGAVATALAQLVTTPLDVVRNRLMTGKNGDGSSLSLEEKNKGYIGSLITLGKEEGLSGLFAGTIPRVSKAVLSGAIQFATYEETKQSMSKILLRR
jgi:solute carrier family 25 S-adenosylmethionine transporter 26